MPMDFNEMCRLLPERASWEVEEYADEIKCSDYNPREFCVFHRESVTVPPAFGTFGCSDDEEFGIYYRPPEKHWGAVCECRYCGETFPAGWISTDHVLGIRLFQGEDGNLYPGYCDKNCEGFIEIAEGDAFSCPMCGCYVELIHAGSIRSGRVDRAQITSIDNIGKYTAIISWLSVSRYDGNGYLYETIEPREAIVIDDSGKLERFSHVYRSMYGERYAPKWRHMQTFSDPMQSRFYSHDYGWCTGSELVRFTGSLYLKTGEKTGLEEYLEANGSYPNVYLKTQRKYPQIENLMKTGWQKLITSAIDEAVRLHNSYNIGQCTVLDIPEELLDFKQVKPHKILRLTKEEYKTGAGSHLSFDEWKAFQNFRGVQKISLTDYLLIREELKDNGLRKVQDMISSGMEDIRNIPRLVNYLKKCKGTETLSNALELYRDYREFLKRLYDDPDPALLYPKDIAAAHDDMATRAAYLQMKAEPAGGFKLVHDTYHELEWTDGELCIILPHCGSELIREGETLRHCVGSYINSHESGRKVVFFVRHRKRPERSYYTLDISVNSFGDPQINQLHGYGNERHGEHREQKHNIPKKVTSFVARWEEEVLKPFFYKRKEHIRNAKDLKTA